MAVHLAVACDVFDGVLFLCCPLSHETSWVRSGTELSQFLRLFLPTQLFVILGLLGLFYSIFDGKSC